MADEPTADALRAMAEHRGLKLVRSRKRTPGIGDYGKFGLTDAAGKPLLGMADEGLTATAGEIEQYLRGGALSSWKLSAETTPERRAPKKKSTKTTPQEAEESPVRRRSKETPKKPAPIEPSRRKQHPPPPPRAKPVLRLVEPDPLPEPDLRVRSATEKDDAALGKLLGQLADPPANRDLARNIGALRRAKAGILVAELSDLVGCCAWATVPTLQRGPVGRITLLLVDAGHRRRGIATALLAKAEERLAKSGCKTVEAMSDIMIANAHNFFRSLKFEQKSYRFVRAIDPPPK